MQSFYTDPQPNGVPQSISFVRRDKPWLKHDSFFDGVGHQEKSKGCDRSQRSAQKTEQVDLLTLCCDPFLRGFETIHLLSAHISAGIAWTGLVAAALAVEAREAGLGTGTRKRSVVRYMKP